MNENSTYLPAVEEIATQAGCELLACEIAPSAGLSEKGFRDYVTLADKKSEEIIVAGLAKLAPSMPVVTEESYSSLPLGIEAFWLVDPLDGTTNYMHGHPSYAISIGLVVQGRPVLGVVYAPRYKERFCACRDGGATLNGMPVRVSDQDSLSRALLAAGFSQRHVMDAMPTFAAAWQAAQAVRHGGSAALDLCYVACGRYDGFWEPVLQPWDFCAGALIVEEAGGAVSAFSSASIGYAQSSSIIASNKRLHNAIANMVGQNRSRIIEHGPN
jgi:myo-inositol-1(or 4)-monophosphatase